MIFSEGGWELSSGTGEGVIFLEGGGGTLNRALVRRRFSNCVALSLNLLALNIIFCKKPQTLQKNYTMCNTVFLKI